MQITLSNSPARGVGTGGGAPTAQSCIVIRVKRVPEKTERRREKTVVKEKTCIPNFDYGGLVSLRVFLSR